MVMVWVLLSFTLRCSYNQEVRLLSTAEGSYDLPPVLKKSNYHTAGRSGAWQETISPDNSLRTVFATWR